MTVDYRDYTYILVDDALRQNIVRRNLYHQEAKSFVTGGAKMEKLNVAIADDNERMLRLLENIIESDEDLNVIGVANAELP